MQTLTHPSNPPADAVGFKTQQSDGFEIANWMQTSKPAYQDTPNAAYKVVKLGDKYLVVWAGRIASK